MTCKNMPWAETNRKNRRKATSMTGRRAHLIDADNLLVDPAITDSETIAATFERYREVSGYQPGDQVFIATGTNGMHVFEVESAWPNARHMRRSGPDGADLELLEIAEWISTSARFSDVVIGSGDRIFLVAYEQLIGAGLSVTVVAQYRHLAVGLASRAHGSIRYLGSGSPAVIREAA